MYEHFIDKKIHDLVEIYGTRNPFEIAKRRNIVIVHEPLGEILGYYNKVRRVQFIHLNNSLEGKELYYVCRHELGHCILHPNESTPQLSAISIVSEMKIEKEADYFATNLTVDGSHEELYLPTKYEILNYYGLPWYLDRYMRY